MRVTAALGEKVLVKFRGVNQVLAWESSCWWVQDSLHGLGAFFTSPAAAGLAALGAALIAAREVRDTRAADNEARRDDRKADSNARRDDRQAELERRQREDLRRQQEDLWARFQWVVDRSTSRAKDQKPALTAVRAVTILTSLRDAARAKPLDDDGLALLIQNFLDHMIATTTQEISG